MDNATREAYAEVDEFLTLLGEEYINKIPKNLRELFKKEKSRNYSPKIDPNIPINKQNFRNETLALIALLNLKFWCDNEKEYEILKAIYANNENK